jgi:GMP synthase-like glutamine amidotransferase
MRTLVVNNYVDQAKYVAAMDNLCAQVKDCFRSNVERVSYEHFTPDFVNEEGSKFDAVVLSGSEALYSRPQDRARFQTAIEGTRRLTLPVLGICGGHQLLAMAHDENIVDMGKAFRDYYEVEILVDDPLFEGLERRVTVRESHQEMVEHLPKRFLLLARSQDTPIEAMKHEKGIAYGVQFHPERYDEAHPAGGVILANFGKLVRR